MRRLLPLACVLVCVPAVSAAEPNWPVPGLGVLVILNCGSMTVSELSLTGAKLLPFQESWAELLRVWPFVFDAMFKTTVV